MKYKNNAKKYFFKICIDGAGMPPPTVLQKHVYKITFKIKELYFKDAEFSILLARVLDNYLFRIVQYYSLNAQHSWNY